MRRAYLVLPKLVRFLFLYCSSRKGTHRIPRLRLRFRSGTPWRRLVQTRMRMSRLELHQRRDQVAQVLWRQHQFVFLILQSE